MQTITLKMPETLVSKLTQLADQEDRSKSYLIRKAVEAYLREIEEDEADYREATRRLQQPMGPSVSLEKYASNHGLEIPLKRKGK